MLDDPLGTSRSASNGRWPPPDIPGQAGPPGEQNGVPPQNGVSPRSGAAPPGGVPPHRIPAPDAMPPQNGTPAHGMPPAGVPPQYGWGDVPEQYAPAVPMPPARRPRIPGHVARLRAAVGHDLLLLPSVSVLLVDGAGRLLLARHAGFHDGWSALGGTVEVGESPAETAVREAREATGSHIRLNRLLDVLGGPDFGVTYPNGDRAAYVTTVYEAEIVSGIPYPADGELSDLAWFSVPELSSIPLNRMTRAVLRGLRAI